MKKSLKYTGLALLALGFIACEKDNMAAPDATIQGRILIQGTGTDQDGQQLQTSQGKDDMKIRMVEDSWKKDENDVVTPKELNVKLDGSYVNTKVFAGTYTMYPYEGAFYPLKAAEYTTGIAVSGTKEQDFKVTPYLLVDWVQKPQLTADRKIRAIVRFRRIAPPGNAAGDMKGAPDVEYGNLYVSTNNLVAKNNRLDEYFRNRKAIKNTDEGTEIVFESDIPVKYPNTTYYVRVGIWVKNNAERNNYTTVVPLEVK